MIWGGPKLPPLEDGFTERGPKVNKLILSLLVIVRKPLLGFPAPTEAHNNDINLFRL
tara:strand:- start:175 stop:345 length:171 start_codon:yes stop_codon:yes gene_type:complete